MQSSENSSQILHLKVDVHLLAAKVGGRQAPAAPGWECQFHYSDEDWMVRFYFNESRWLQPGESCRMDVEFRVPEYQNRKIRMGMPFLIREGGKTVGYGIVTGIYDASLERPDAGEVRV